MWHSAAVGAIDTPRRKLPAACDAMPLVPQRNDIAGARDAHVRVCRRRVPMCVQRQSAQQGPEAPRTRRVSSARSGVHTGLRNDDESRES